MVNQQFRRDYWVKGPRKLSALEQAEALRAQKFILATHRPDISLKVSGSLGEATMSEAIYKPILDFLADHKPKTLGQIEQASHGAWRQLRANQAGCHAALRHGPIGRGAG